VEPKSNLNRRTFLLGSVGAMGALAGCTTIGTRRVNDAEAARMYGAVPSEQFPVPAVDVAEVDPKYYRTVVPYSSSEPAGTIIIDPGAYYVYRIEGEGIATRFGANVGRAGFLWSGDAYIGRKAEWPIWTPTPAQMGRDPSLVQYAGGMRPGLDNPLGARALYLYQNGVYTLYTIYGTNQAWSLGQNVSSGCVGLLNQDIIYLYDQTPVGTNVIVLPA
jgi:lipoprotein-anchoring transpeptidase ErfK/SrfK